MTFGELMMGEAFALNGDHFIKTNRIPEGYDKNEGWREAVHLEGSFCYPPIPPQMEVRKVKLKVSYE